MNSNEKIFVTGFSCRSVEDVYNDGETGGCTSQWGDSDIGMDIRVAYDTVEDALNAVAKANCFDIRKSDWMNFGVECTGEPEDFSRFDADVLVDADNSQATESQVASWKKGEIKLYNCHVYVWLEVRSVGRNLTEAEARNALA